MLKVRKVGVAGAPHGSSSTLRFHVVGGAEANVPFTSPY
jgi:hypothetical protein